MLGKLTSICCLLLFVCIASCSKKSGTPGGKRPPPLLPDSLGTGWQRIIIDSSRHFEDIFFPDNTTGYVGGYSDMYKSTDAGLTWKHLTVPAGTSTIRNIFFIDSLHGCALELTDLIKTNDGGKSWKKIVLPITESGDLQFLNPRLGYLVADHNLLVSTDSGNTWAKTPGTLISQPNSLFFLDSLHGWICGNGPVETTIDGGKTFTELPTAGSMYIVKFIDAQHGWTGGPGGGFLRTINGGAFWQDIGSPGFYKFDFDFFDASNGFVSDSKFIYKTTDGGITKIPVVQSFNGQIIEIHFNDMHHGWGVNDFGYIYRYNQ